MEIHFLYIYGLCVGKVCLYYLIFVVFFLFIHSDVIFIVKGFEISGRIVEMLEALEAMAKDKLQIPQRAMILSRKYRTLVSSWIEPLQEEAELGYEIDYIARYCFCCSNYSTSVSSN